MTDNYLVFFLLISLYFFIKFELKNNIYLLLFSNLFLFLGFLVKQNALFLGLAYSIYLVIKTINAKSLKQLSFVILQAVFCIGIFTFYQVVFPKTQIMLGARSVHLEKLDNPSFIFSTFYSSVVYIISFLIPLCFVFILSTIECLDRKKRALAILISIIISIFALILFDPSQTKRGEYPYFQNITEKAGFYALSIPGLKYGLVPCFLLLLFFCFYHLSLYHQKIFMIDI